MLNWVVKFLTAVLVAVTCLMAFTIAAPSDGQSATPVVAEPFDPASVFFQGYLATGKAEQLEAAGDFSGALEQLGNSSKLFESIQKSTPAWKPEMVNSRLTNTAAMIESVRKKAKEPHPKDQAALVENQRKGDIRSPVQTVKPEKKSPSLLPSAVTDPHQPAPKALAVIPSVPPSPVPPLELPTTKPAAIPSPIPQSNPSSGSVEKITAANGAGDFQKLPTKGLRVLILSDSMGLSGFSEKLDGYFRSDSRVAMVHTFAACGTNPLSWMKLPPYSKISTRCGYMRIESVVGKVAPEKELDTYGMTRGYRPVAHRVPKIEDLVVRIKPDIIVFQNGNNFFDLFKQGKIIKEKPNRAVILAHMRPMVNWLATNAPSVRKLYWVSPPQAGNVTPEVQQFIFETIQSEVVKIGIMLDSRTITSYPYKSQAKDKMHFGGQAARDWATDIFRLICDDLEANDINLALALTERIVKSADPEAAKVQEGDVSLRVRLKSATPVPGPEVFAPYGEYMVGHLYDVLEVRAGTYGEKELLVLHPAYIKHVKQDLTRFQGKREMEFIVSEIKENSLWATVHRRDSVGPPELYPHMLNEDIDRHPDSAECSSCNR